MRHGQAGAFAVGLCVGWVGIAVGAQPQVDTAWIRYYNGPGNGSDIADAIVVDHAGNVYVTGQSWNGETQDYVTLKYRPSGSLEWERHYSGQADFGSEATVLAIDADGNICITGANSYGSAHHGYCVLTYDPHGNLLWEQWRNWPAGGPTHIHGVQADSTGAIYVIGLSGSFASAPRYATMKFAPSGSLLWDQEYGAMKGPVDIANALAIDPSGNVYVTGQSWNRGGSNFLTIKYNARGDLLWKERYDGRSTSIDVPKSLRVDPSGAVYVTGCSHSKAPDCDIITLKYTADGRQAWVRTYSTSSRSPDRVSALQVDASGNVLVCGFSRGDGPDFDYITLKYGPNGDLLWEQRYDGPSGSRDAARALTLDTAGNIYVTGASWFAGAGYNFLTVKYVQNAIRLH